MPRVNPNAKSVTFKTNKPWFLKCFADQSRTASKIADEMGIDRAHLSLLLSDQRPWQVNHLVWLAKLINRPLLEVLKNVGLEKEVDLGGASYPRQAIAPVPVAEPPAQRNDDTEFKGHVDARGLVSYTDKSVRVPVPAQSDVQYALRVNASTSPFDGSMMLVLAETDAERCTGRICVVNHAGSVKLCRLRRGIADGHYDLLPLFDASAQAEHEVALKTAEPVRWMLL
jgi:hypothetical protein